MAVKHEVKGEAIYTASKAAINSLTRVMAKEIYGYGITCNVVAPSAIKTDLMDSIDEDALQSVLNQNAIPKVGKMEDIRNTIDWLIEPRNDSITGQVIYLGGV
jgi:3-oxoacyl-[acyl-carrier protein] reductase